MHVDVRWGSASHAGCVRSKNQDSLLSGPVLFVVADGMGGHAAGEIASAIAVAEMSKLGDRRSLSVADVLEGAARANAEILEAAARDPALASMGTTLAGLALVTDEAEGSVLVFNIGDSRVYQYCDGSLVQLTRDHSIVGEMVREGELTSEAARVHPSRNVVTRALGVTDSPVLDHWSMPPALGDRYLICSDGLSNEVSDEELAEATRPALGEPQSVADALLQLALERGARDNVSVVVVEITGVRDRADEDGEDDDTNPKSSIEHVIEAIVDGAGPLDGETETQDPELITGIPTFFDLSTDPDGALFGRMTG